MNATISPRPVTVDEQGTRIVRIPGVCGGRPHIEGRRIKVQHIAIWHERMGMTPEEIVAEHSTLTLGNVHAALGHYFDHCAEIEADIADDDDFVKSLQAKSDPTLLPQKLAALRATNHQVSP